MPQNALSITPVPGAYVHGDTHPAELLVDHEPGGVALSDPSQGLHLKIWTLELVGNDVVVSAADVAPVVLFNRPNVTELSLAFDQNMRPAVAYVASGIAWLWWFDTDAVAHVHTELVGASNPRVTLDDKRTMQVGNSDLILGYMVGTTLFMRKQRDRFAVTYQLKTDIDRPLMKIAMNDKLRLQFEFGQPP